MARSKNVPDDQKVAIVTGGARGLGLEICKELLAMGMTVTAVDIREETLVEAKAAVDSDKFHTAVLDVTDSAGFEATVAAVVERDGRLDVLVNNAGITRDQIFMRMSDDEWQSVLNVNLTSTMRLCRGVMRPMMKARWGRIVNISSIVGATGNPGQANYAASKAGMIGLTKSIA